MTEELRCMIALGEVRGIGPTLAKALVDQLGSAEEVMHTAPKDLEEVEGIGPKTAACFAQRDAALARADRELEFMQRYGIEGLAYRSEHFPKRLRGLAESPIVLYKKGNADLDARRVLSIVGTRRPTEEGRENAERIVAEMAAAFPDVLIVSGLAYGVDVCAHRTALRSGVPTAGVLAHGLDRLYPAAHRDVAAQMVGNGALLSDYMSGTRPDQQNFVMRNRIIAALADVTLVVESGLSGGSLVTARVANKIGRKVVALPGSLRNEMARGCNTLIKTGDAKLVETAADIASLMGWGDPTIEKQGPVQGELFPVLPEREQTLYDMLLAEGDLSASDLSVRTSISINDVTATLLEMEFSGMVKALPGNIFRVLR